MDPWGFRALFPCTQGILAGPLAEDESLRLEHPHHVSVALPTPSSLVSPMVLLKSASGLRRASPARGPQHATLSEPW